MSKTEVICDDKICEPYSIQVEDCLVYYGRDCQYPCSTRLCETEILDGLNYCTLYTCRKKVSPAPIIPIHDSSIPMILGICISFIILLIIFGAFLYQRKRRQSDRRSNSVPMTSLSNQNFRPLPSSLSISDSEDEELLSTPIVRSRSYMSTSS